jgi:hypothetical protein
MTFRKFCQDELLGESVYRLYIDELDDTLYTEDDQSPPVDHLNLTVLAKHLPCLKELRITYGIRRCGLNFTWNSFHFTLQVSRKRTPIVSPPFSRILFVIAKSAVFNVVG